MARARKIIAPQASAENKSVILNEGAPDPEKDIMTPEHRRALNRADARKELVSIADQLAGDVMFFKNYRWPDAIRHYPEDHDAMMRFVSRYYPHAKPRALYVDEPSNHRDVARCEEKRKIMKASGLRYVVLNRGYQTPDGLPVDPETYLGALEQLGE
jgi:hypothetical protein